MLDLLYKEEEQNDDDDDGAGRPPEHSIECACEIVMTIGPVLDSTAHGTKALSQIESRLAALQHMRRGDDASSPTAYSKRIFYTIQDVLDLRKANWKKGILAAA